MHHRELEAVRRIVRQVLGGRSTEFDPQAVSESVLLRGSRVIGQQFKFGRVKFHWLAGQQRLWIFEEGKKPCEIDLTQPPIAHKAA